MISPSSLAAFTSPVTPTPPKPPVQRVRETAQAGPAQRSEPPQTRTVPATPPTQFTPRGSFLNLSV